MSLDSYLQAYNMLDMNVLGLLARGVSITNSMTVGNLDANDSVIMAPLADHVNASICPGVSITAKSRDSARLDRRSITWSIRVEKRLSAVIMAPFGPSPYCFMTSL